MHVHYFYGALNEWQWKTITTRDIESVIWYNISSTLQFSVHPAEQFPNYQALHVCMVQCSQIYNCHKFVQDLSCILHMVSSSVIHVWTLNNHVTQEMVFIRNKWSLHILFGMLHSIMRAQWPRWVATCAGRAESIWPKFQTGLARSTS